MQPGRPTRWLPIVLCLFAACGLPSPTEPTEADYPGLPPLVLPPLPQDVSPVIASMLNQLPARIAFSYQENLDLIPRNRDRTAFYEQKLEMLATPGLINQIVDDRRWVEAEATTVHGVTPIGAVFPLEWMRGECADATRVLEESLPFLVEFMGQPFPTGRLEVWYGFKMGATGGGGRISTVDRTTSLAATPDPLLPYEAVLMHEASHTFISNEALTQFLELYVYNVRLGLGADPLGWKVTRGWSPTTPSPFGVNGVMDIYYVVGLEPIRRAYRAIAPLNPAYGRPLTDAVIAAFVAEMPEAHRAFAEERLRTIIA